MPRLGNIAAGGCGSSRKSQIPGLEAARSCVPSWGGLHELWVGKLQGRGAGCRRQGRSGDARSHGIEGKLDGARGKKSFLRVTGAFEEC